MPAPPRPRRHWKFNRNGRVLVKYWGGTKDYYKLDNGVWKRWLGNQWIHGVAHGTQWGPAGPGDEGQVESKGAKMAKDMCLGKTNGGFAKSRGDGRSMKAPHGRRGRGFPTDHP